MSSTISIGIDLGTTNSVAARLTSEGNAEVLATNPDDPLIPSVVSYDGGKLLVGRPAINNALNAPQNTIFSIKRLMGRTIEDEDLKRVDEIYAYQIVQAKDFDPTDETEDEGVRVVLNGIERTPAWVSARILECVRDEARAAAQDKDICYAVITVPAYFTEIQRSATYEAGRQARLIIKQLLDEPTAAAISYAHDYSDQDHYMMVFDMGGGTLDVSILEIVDRTQYYVSATSGDMWLGGDDFDEAIVKLITEEIQKTYRIDPSGDPRYRVLAKHEAERVKKLLSKHDAAQIRIPFAITSPGGSPIGVNMRITRQKFEECISPTVDKAMSVVADAMRKRNLTPQSLSLVLMVGGSSYVPLVQRRLMEIFGEDKVELHAEPMKAVALGAAILAENLQGLICPNPDCQQLNDYGMDNCVVCGWPMAGARADTGHLITDLQIPQALGIGVIGEDGQQDHFAEIIPAHTPYPLDESMTRTFETSGRRITIPVYEGEDEAASKNAYLGVVEYELPPDVAHNTTVIVHFNYDNSRCLVVGLEFPEYPDLNIYKSSPARRQPRDPDKSPQWGLRLRNITLQGETILQDYKDLISSDQRKILEDMIRQSKQAQIQNNENTSKNLYLKLSSELWDLGVPFYLFVAAYLQRSGVYPEDSKQLGELSVMLTKAYKDGMQAQVDRYTNKLLPLMSAVIDKLTPEQDAFTNESSGLVRLFTSKSQ